MSQNTGLAFNGNININVHHGVSGYALYCRDIIEILRFSLILDCAVVLRVSATLEFEAHSNLIPIRLNKDVCCANLTAYSAISVIANFPQAVETW